MTTATTTTAASHTPIKSIVPNSYVSGTYSLFNPQVGVTRAGKPFLKCLLRDATGEAPGRQWTFEESGFNDLIATGFVWVDGRSELYRDQIQIVIDRIKAVEVSAEEITQLLPSTSRDIDEMFARVTAIMQSLDHPAMRALASVYLEDETLMGNFRVAPAAVSLHHAWIGGLLEHTLQLLELAEVMLPLYPQLNRDLVLMGLFLHDLAKTTELTWEKGFNYTLEGNLVGHIVQGAIWLQIKSFMAAKQGPKLPAEALKVLQHIVVSHHGLPEHGAARVPSTPEAIFVAMLDNLEAKTQLALTTAERGDPVACQGFTDKVWALDTRLYRPDPLRLDDGSAGGATSSPPSE